MILENDFDYQGEELQRSESDEVITWCPTHGGYECGAGGMTAEQLTANWLKIK
jgi:hypothetical protein